MSETLCIIVVEPDRERALMIVDGLVETGDHDILIISDVSGLANRIAEKQPDIVLADLESPTRDVLEELTLASSPLERPVALFVNDNDPGLMKAAIDSGISAYVVDGMRKDRIQPIVDAAVARFNMFRRVREELLETKRALEDRKIIDRAKGLLMKSKGLSEEEAYGALRKTAMDQGARISDVARALVTSADLLL